MTPVWNEAIVRRLVRDVAIALGLLLLTWQLWGMAEARSPQFQMSDVYILEADVAGFTHVDVVEHAAAPQNTTSIIRSRSAFQLEGYPPNLVFYLRGSPWDMEQDIPVGTNVRIEVLDAPNAQAERARDYPETVLAQPLEGLAVNGKVINSASETVARAEAAASGFHRAALAAGALALGWIGWLGWAVWQRSKRRPDKAG